VEQAKQTAVDQSERIEGDMLLIVDRSGSMQNAITTAIEFGARIAPLCDGEIMVVTHNDHAQEVTVANKASLQGWQQAFMGIRANGQTNMQRALELALQRGFMPQKIVLVTDGGENQGSFRRTVDNYAEQGIEPAVVQITVDSGERNQLARNMQDTHLRYDQFVYEGDYYVFDQVASVIGGPPAKSLIEKILETQFPHRRK
jgi:Mg-chelatase subunit ChlD